MNALLHCVEDAKTFCRVRADAAKALGACACDDTQRSNLAMTSVMRTYRKRRCDPETGLPAPTDLRNYADALVDEGLVAALGLPRVPAREAAANDMVDYTTPSECVDLLVDMLNNLESDGDPHDMSSLVATALRALGAASLEKTDALQSSLDAISRWLTKDVKHLRRRRADARGRTPRHDGGVGGAESRRDAPAVARARRRRRTRRESRRESRVEEDAEGRGEPSPRGVRRARAVPGGDRRRVEGRLPGGAKSRCRARVRRRDEARRRRRRRARAREQRAAV